MCNIDNHTIEFFTFLKQYELSKEIQVEIRNMRNKIVLEWVKQFEYQIGR